MNRRTSSAPSVPASAVIGGTSTFAGVLATADGSVAGGGTAGAASFCLHPTHKIPSRNPHRMSGACFYVRAPPVHSGASGNSFQEPTKRDRVAVFDAHVTGVVELEEDVLRALATRFSVE